MFVHAAQLWLAVQPRTSTAGTSRNWHAAWAAGAKCVVISCAISFRCPCRDLFQCDFDIAGSYAAMVPDAEVLGVLLTPHLLLTLHLVLLLLLQGVLPVRL